MAADLSILLFARLDAPWADTTVATDACMTGIGVTAAQCSEVDLQKLALLPVPDFNIPSEVDRTMPSPQWRTIVSSGWHYPEHINILELRALDTGLRWLTSMTKSAGARLLMWSDSAVHDSVGVAQRTLIQAFHLTTNTRYGSYHLGKRCGFLLQLDPDGS